MNTEIKSCAHCNEEFWPQATNQLYCSLVCKSRAQYARRRRRSQELHHERDELAAAPPAGLIVIHNPTVDELNGLPLIQSILRRDPPVIHVKGQLPVGTTPAQFHLIPHPADEGWLVKQGISIVRSII